MPSTTKTQDPVAEAQELAAEADRELKADQSAETNADDALEKAVQAETEAAERGAGENELKQLATERRSAEDATGWARSKKVGTAKRLEAAETVLVDARKAAARERAVALVEQRIQCTRELSKASKVIARGVGRYRDLTDQLLQGVTFKGGQVTLPNWPSLRQLRGEPYLLQFLLAPLRDHFTRDIRPVHRAYRQESLAVYERRLWRNFLNGAAEDAEKIEG